MKRTLSLLLSLALLLALLPACQQPADTPDPTGSPSDGPELTAKSIVDAVFPHSGCTDPDSVEYLNAEESPDQLSFYIENAYGLESWEDGAIIRATGASAFELVVLKLADEDAAVLAASSLMSYISARQGDFAGYAPAEADMVANGGLNQKGPYAALFICPDPDSADAAFAAALEGGELPNQPSSSAPAVSLSLDELANAVWFALFEELDLTGRPLPVGNTDYYLTDVLGLPQEDCKEISVLDGNGYQLTLLRCVDEDAARRSLETLEARIADFDQGAVVRALGNYVGYFYFDSPDAGRAGDIFLEVLSSNPQPVRLAPVTSDPAVKLNDLLLRLMVESGVCDWEGLPVKAWTAVDKDNLREAAAMFGALPSQYEAAVYAWWDPEISPDYRSVDNAPCLLAIFQTAGEEEAKALLPALNRGPELRRAYLQDRLDYYTAPDFDAELYASFGIDLDRELDQLTRALAMLDHVQTTCAGRYAALLICDNPAPAVVALPRFASSPDTVDYFANYYDSQQPASPDNPDLDYPDRTAYVDPQTDDMSLYDTSAIRAAWESRDPGQLSSKDRETYDAAKGILDKILQDGMTDLEKETAIYHWLVNNVDYDWRHQNIMATTPRESYEPYGGLVDHTAVCLGYATSFQLLMDLAGVECITIAGAAFHSQENHGWNMVRLNGQWYCVDVTWDANYREQIGPGEPEDWDYFNITSDEMASNHQWDYRNTPEATATDHGQG